MFGQAGVKVNILKLRDAKDADEFLHRFGAAPFEALIRGAKKQADFLFSSLQSRFDLTKDDQRVEFAAKAAELIATFQSAAECEVYADRAAKAAGVSRAAMLAETAKAYRKRQNIEKRRLETSST